ncbi:MAG: hypothetical protein SGILL_005683 [Bacillariaceae sp.]
MKVCIQRIFRYYPPRYYPNLRIAFPKDMRNERAIKSDQTFYAIHPHGAFCMGWGTLFLHQAFESVRFCFAPYLYMTPFFRLFTRCTGRPGSAGKTSMITYLKEGESLALLPGGFEEATLTCMQQDRVFIKKRTGFIRLCLQHGVAVRPVFVFGEKDCYWNVQGGWDWRLTLNRYGIPTILTWGRWWIPLLPKKDASLFIAVGNAINLPRIENPSKEQVKQWHDKYVTALTRLYDDNKDEAYGPTKAKAMKLEVW